ncbi:MAG: RNA-directed DNA polymerase [Bacteroidetes bacterium]|nr:RNA-directed DNA polymerase [Bacteroidota bacterium]
MEQIIMELEKKDIDQIKVAFGKMRTKEDLLKLLNLAKPFVYGKNAVPFQLKQLTWYATPTLNKNRYFEFEIAKKSGEKRKIQAPRRGLKALQKTLSFILQSVFEPHEAAMGFTKGKSVVDNARIHVNSHYIYNLDLKDFFHSIDQARFWKCLQLKPFHLINELKEQKEYMGYDEFCAEYLEPDEVLQFEKTKTGKKAKTKFGTVFMSDYIDFESEKYVIFNGRKPIKSKDKIGPISNLMRIKNKIPTIGNHICANLISSLCFQETLVERKDENDEWIKVKKNVLPQGAPSSPVITNIICQKLDLRLSGVAKRFGLRYSRYADDITFSSLHNVFQNESEFLKEIQRIITQQGFHIKESKTRLQKEGYRQEVTGLVVNKKANVGKRYIKELRSCLNLWERYGYERASGFFLQQYIADKGHVKNGKPDMANVISGKLDYLKMVKGADNELYLKLKTRFDALSGTINPFEELLNIWENKGIDVAMNHYYKENTK